MRSYQQFFAELKRRRVFRVAGIYGIVSFGVLQAADLMLPRLGVPDWTVTFMVALVVLAFPVALILAWAFEVTPDGVMRTDNAAPGEIEAIVSAPASQRWPAGLMALVGVAALVGSTWWIARTTAPGVVVEPARANLISGMQLVDLSEDTRPSIAVLPFVNMSADEEQEYFSDGMTEEILNTLAKIKALRVAGRTSAFAYKGENKDLREIGSELGVRHLIEGSVRKDGDQLRITAQLIDVADGSHLWTESYTRPAATVFDIQIEIAEAIADALKVPLGLDDAANLVTPTADLEAYDLYLAGRSRLRERGQGTLDAIELFEAAIDRDSAWAPAWAGLAEAMELSLWGMVEYDSTSFYRTLAEAEEVARRALELQPQNPAALVALGSIHRDRMEWADAERFYRQALDLDPDNAEAHHQYGEWLAKRGRTAEAVVSMDRATILDPAPVRVAQLINMLRQDTRWDEAEEVLQWALGQGMAERLGVFEERAWPTIMPILRAVEEGRFEDQMELIIAAGFLDLPADSVGFGAYLRAMEAGQLDLIPDSIRANLNLVAYDFIALGEPELAVDEFLIQTEGASPLAIDQPRRVWWVLHDPIRPDPRYHAYMESIGLGGLEVQRTPVDQRVRPAILRQADAQRAAAAAAGDSTP